jgi:hypothetical protein
MRHSFRARRCSSMQVRHIDRSRPRRVAERWVSFCLLLRRLPRVRALPRTARRAGRSGWHRHLPNATRARAARGRSGRASVRAFLATGTPLVRRLLPDTGREHGGDAGLPDRRDAPCIHGSRSRNGLSRRGPRGAVVPHLRTLRSWAAATRCAATAFGGHVRSTRVEDARLASTWAPPPEPVLRRARGSARRAADLAAQLTLDKARRAARWCCSLAKD